MAKSLPKTARGAPTTIHAATLGRMGEVIKGPTLSMAQAIDERRQGRDVVVCGSAVVANLQVAQQIEGQATQGQCVFMRRIAAPAVTHYPTFSPGCAGRPVTLLLKRRRSGSPSEHEILYTPATGQPSER
jgi:hypothetical protein